MKIIEAETKEELEQLRVIIQVAHSWALVHFNAFDAKGAATLLDRPAFFVEFPALDKMIVWRALYGKKLEPAFHYQLVLSNKGPYWLGKHPIYGTYLPQLRIAKRS